MADRVLRSKTMSSTGWLQSWFVEQCDGQWEHIYGVRIETLDNPGWSVEIDLAETPLAGLTMPVHLEERSDTDWISYEARDDKFIAHGGSQNLDELLAIFKEWWEKRDVA